MSLEEVRNKNKQKVIEIALECFVKDGIEATKISTIAKKANLAERSVYRYFETKSDLILAAAKYFSDMTTNHVSDVYFSDEISNMNGKEQIIKILKAYADLFFNYQHEIVFFQEAATYLFRNQIGIAPFTRLSLDKLPLNMAIKNAIEDESIIDVKNIEKIYQVAYDGLFAMMQNIAIMHQDKEIAQKRLYDYCDVMGIAFCK